MALQKKPRKTFEADPNEVRYTFETIGQKLAGYYLGSETFVANGDSLTKHRVKPSAADPKVVTFLGNSVLNDLLTDDDTNTWVEIEYIEKRTSKAGRPYQMFEVASDPDKRISA